MKGNLFWGVGGFSGPASHPTFTLHIVLPLKLHLAGPKEVELGTARSGCHKCGHSLSMECMILWDGVAGNWNTQQEGAGEKELKTLRWPGNLWHWGHGGWGIGQDKEFAVSSDLPSRPQRSILKAELERDRKTQIVRDREERDQSQMPIEMLPIIHTCAWHLYFASPFHRWNAEAQGGEENVSHLKTKGKRVHRGVLDLQTQPCIRDQEGDLDKQIGQEADIWVSCSYLHNCVGDIDITWKATIVHPPNTSESMSKLVKMEWWR